MIKAISRRRWLTGVGALGLSGCASVPLPGDGPRKFEGPPVLTEPKPVVRRPPKVGLALGGGAARGFAHVGVIAVLEQNGLRPDLVVGTSAGSLVAALYASGKSAAELEKAAMSMEEAMLTDWTLPLINRGMLRGNALAKYVNAQVDGRLIENMALPLGIVATDLASGEGVLFQRGDTGTAVRASSAVPGVFEPVPISGKEYVDGGLVAPVPVRYAQQMGAELVIAVDISSPPQGSGLGDTFKVMLQTFTIMGQSINRWELKEAHVLVRPQLAGVGSAAFAERQKSMAAGKAAMQAALPVLRAQMERRAVAVASR